MAPSTLLHAHIHADFEEAKQLLPMSVTSLSRLVIKPTALRHGQRIGRKLSTDVCMRDKHISTISQCSLKARGLLGTIVLHSTNSFHITTLKAVSIF